VWLSCGGRSEEDKENLGKIEYFPEQGFPGYYYPFHNQIGFRSPIVAVQIVNPKRKSSNTSFCNYVSNTDQYIHRFKFSTLWSALNYLFHHFTDIFSHIPYLKMRGTFASDTKHYNMKVYRTYTGNAQLMLDHSTNYKLAVSFTYQPLYHYRKKLRHQLDRTMDGRIRKEFLPVLVNKSQSSHP